jgi:hypothetical protein
MSTNVYDEFINARLDEGQTIEQIESEIKKRLLPVAKLCAYCQNEGALLCDRVIGFEKKGVAIVPSRFIKDAGVTKPTEYDYIGFDSEMFTCDLLICNDCRTQGAPKFFCGQDGAVVIPDYCKEHAKQGEVPLNEMVMTHVQAQVIRNRMRMRILAQHPCMT